MLLSQAIEIWLEDEWRHPLSAKTSGASGPLLKSHKFSKFGHTANRCRSSERFPHTFAQEFRNDSMEVTNDSWKNKSYYREVVLRKVQVLVRRL